MRILITGGCGFIGCNLVNALNPDVYNITVFDKQTTNQKYFKNPYNLIVDDLQTL